MSRFTTYCAFLFLFVQLNECTGKLNKEARKDPCEHWSVGDWKPYKKDTCIKIEQSRPQNYSEAQAQCEYYEGHLVTIDSAEKQKFVEEHLKSENLQENIWIGLKYSTEEKNYVWPYDRIVDYANWEKGHPTNDAKNCVELKTESGKWSEKPCLETNRVLCERLQKWSNEELQTKLMYLTKDKVQLETKIKDLVLSNDQKMKNLMNDVIPIGFIYVQLPKDKPPTKIWPQFKWITVSHEYGGVFFRVEGKNASAFGNHQDQSTERINKVDTKCTTSSPTVNHHWGKITYIESGVWSNFVFTGGPKTACEIQFKVENAEIRPGNMAIRIWRRTA